MRKFGRMFILVDYFNFPLFRYNPMTESRLKAEAHPGKPASWRQPSSLVLFDAPVTSPLAEIAMEYVVMFFVNQIRGDMIFCLLQTASRLRC